MEGSAVFVKQLTKETKEEQFDNGPFADRPQNRKIETVVQNIRFE